ncbi:MAG TPA: glucoamylase family protein [Terriglobales bacterium]|nr:glucoamylase family protein [Terriglobales bacterium]
MPKNTHLEIATAEAERLPEHAIHVELELSLLRAKGAELAKLLAWIPKTVSSDSFQNRFNAMEKALLPVFPELDKVNADEPSSEDFRWLHDNIRLVIASIQDTSSALQLLRKLPHVRDVSGAIVPRVAAIADQFIQSANLEFSDEGFSAFVTAFQEHSPLQMAELWALPAALKLSLLEQIAHRAPEVLRDRTAENRVGVCVRSLRDAGQAPWKDIVEPLVCFDQILKQDPAGAYAQMDFQSRELYRDAVVEISAHSDMSEVEVAGAALELAKDARHWSHANPRLAMRRSHVGYYLVAEGATLLHRKAGYRPGLGTQIQMILRRHPDEFYLPAIELLTLGIMAAILRPLLSSSSSLALVLFAMVIAVLPCSQSATELINYLVTTLLKPKILPKLDLSDGIPDECLTMIVVPTLLLNEKQVRRLVDDLEVRYLGNHDRNLHFALLTDLADSQEPPNEDDPLVKLCSDLISALNDKYAAKNAGSFLLLHRHRIYNPREQVWMGWERKRGKLLDLNKLLKNEYDSFPVKVGDLSILPRVRYVITLDSDTELPRGSAHRMVGAIAHPLNQAIIDPVRNVVVSGYGILQPRVGVSVQSASRSRLANIYSGQTGFDIYTRAISDVYQDLYGEGIYTGKGIFEVETLHQVLNERFPRNALLSHDLIEGAYARAGLVTDIEVIDDYPSHYSAYNRRKHRWLRGDWQIAGWLGSHVTNEAGERERNPISISSQWKILDNLRRSLVEPGTFLFLLLGWFALPEPARYWTIATVIILFLPSWFHFLFTLGRALAERSINVALDAVSGLFTANVNVLLTLTFLAHQALLSLDAILRALVRRLITRRGLLEWETAAQAELGHQKRTAVDVYLDWTPIVAVVLGLAIYYWRRESFWAALPILILWAFSKLVSSWLNRSPRALRKEVSKTDEMFLKQTALRTWRYFAEFSTAEHNWLVPDNVQEDPAKIAPRISPTNMGFLLNARQAAHEFGYLTLPEFAALNARTLQTMRSLERAHGHFLNWYDTQTLQPLPPKFVSSVDNGNLVASLWTLQQGCLNLLRKPLLQASLAEGAFDILVALRDLRACTRRNARVLQRGLRGADALKFAFSTEEDCLSELEASAAGRPRPADAVWFAAELRRRATSIREAVRDFTPWLLPEFASLRKEQVLAASDWENLPALRSMPEFIERIEALVRMTMFRTGSSPERQSAVQQLAALLAQARANAIRLINQIRSIANQAGELADEMDFGMLLDPRRKLLSVGYDAEVEKLHSACYDLLASESRIAAFVAIAKEDIEQDCWFLLGRTHTVEDGRPVLVSWTGTMFEYLMPALWMRSYPNTLLDRSRAAAVRAQQAYATRKGVPWGISESAYFKLDEAGNYQYHAFGLPGLALHKDEMKALVISPYSAALALGAVGSEAVKDLRRMHREGWFASYGFYEAADFTPSARRSRWHRYELVRCWMAHHQGMTLLSITNFLRGGVVQEWFHADPRVQASELLLHEKPVAHVRAGRAGLSVATS